ncbi:MAG: hypothetical protein H0V87_01055 [Chloroflexi bacterium]|nr:hypothetical protein [Chloroflexota bacterium]
MIERRPPFGTEELPASEPSAELATSLATGRELESAAGEVATAVSTGFTSRVMTAIALEPVPQPATVAGRALRGGRPLAVLAAVRDAWRVARTGGRPAAARAQAMALVLVVVVGLGAVVSIGGSAMAGALGLFDRDAPTPSVPVLPTPSPSVAPTPPPTPSPTPSPTPLPSTSPSATVSPSPTETASPGETDEPQKTADPSDDSSGPGSGSGSGSGGSGPGSNAGPGSASGSGS